MIVVSDTTPISELTKVGYLDLLPELFGEIVIPQGVYDELTTGQHPAVKIVQDLSWLNVVVVVENKQAVAELQQLGKLDFGESEAIALTKEIKVDLLLIRDKSS